MIAATCAGTTAPAKLDGWAYSVLQQIDSTNTYAARLPAWTAVRADTQAAGRGRTKDRRWVSDAGGLWLSAVLPCPGPRSTWETLPLAAGWAVVNAVRGIGVLGARLRWPNDVMVGHAKLAGLLVERYTDDTAVVGIGLNVFNRPERELPELKGHAVGLSQLVAREYGLDDVAKRVLRALAAAHAEMLEKGFAGIADELNQAWGEPRRVEITLNETPAPMLCLFHGIDHKGRLRVTTPTGGLQRYDATQVSLFRETET